MNKMLLSIIVPIYNAAEFLEECIESLINQHLPSSDYEIILINDGSSDTSGHIAKEYSAKYENIYYFEQENQGQAVARNKGLDKVRGEFVMFVDSDDYISKDSINQILSKAKDNDLDICEYLLNEYQEDGSYKISMYQPFDEKIVYSGETALLGGVKIASVCTNIYHREFINKYNLRFSTGIAHEDVEFNMRAYAFAKRIMFTHICAYNYRWNPTSTDRSREIGKIERSVFSNFVIAKKTLDFISTGECTSTLESHYKKRINSLVAACILSLLIRDRKLVSEDCVNKSISYLNDNNLLPLKGKALTWKMTIICKFINAYNLLFLR